MFLTCIFKFILIKQWRSSVHLHRWMVHIIVDVLGKYYVVFILGRINVSHFPRCSLQSMQRQLFQSCITHCHNHFLSFLSSPSCSRYKNHADGKYDLNHKGRPSLWNEWRKPVWWNIFVELGQDNSMPIPREWSGMSIIKPLDWWWKRTACSHIIGQITSASNLYSYYYVLSQV